MYEKFYGLKEAAFNLTPDPAFLFLNKRSKDALDHVLYGIERREGFAVIVGDIGTGKTTMCWALLERLARKNVCTAMIQNPMLSETDILRSILQDLGVRPEKTQHSANSSGANGNPQEIFNTDWMQGMNKKQLLDRLNSFLAARAQEDVFTVLIVDEAQNVSMSLLEQMRLLSNLETAKKKLIQIIFVGQLELEKKLRLPSLRQLNQRISVRFETKALSRDDTERYIRHRIAVAGGAPRLHFKGSAFRAIWNYSKGYPRLINLICDRALLAAYMDRSPVIAPKYVRKAVHNLQGKENLVVRIPSGWVRRMAPIFVPVLLLIFAIFFFVYKGLAL
jgi:general secretion pathway protein A